MPSFTRPPYKAAPPLPSSFDCAPAAAGTHPACDINPPTAPNKNIQVEYVKILQQKSKE
jgi:hypothetical protein